MQPIRKLKDKLKLSNILMTNRKFDFYQMKILVYKKLLNLFWLIKNGDN